MKLIYLSFFIVLLSCKSKYEKGYDAGFDEGHAEGYAQTYGAAFDNGLADGRVDGYDLGYNAGNYQGYEQGFQNARDQFASQDYLNGYATGDSAGYVDGYAIGMSDGSSDGQYDGSIDGSHDGYHDGYDVGYDEGYDSGYSSGYDSAGGYDIGYSAGYSAGYSDGSSDYDYDHSDDSSDDGYRGLGNSLKSSNPSVRLAAMVNSDLIDYSKLEKFNSSSALENGSMVFSHADSGSVDMEKLSALKEQHYLNQMAKQLVVNYSLSNESASKIARVAHQFNKISGSRNVSEKDAKAFSEELVGFDLAKVRGAVQESMKGNSADLNNLLDKASKTMGATPEQLNKMISKIFN